MRSGLSQSVSHTDRPRPSAVAAPSIWYAEVDTPHKNPEANADVRRSLTGSPDRSVECETSSDRTYRFAYREVHDVSSRQDSWRQRQEGDMLPANTTHLRRRPVQQRSAARVERMLEACATLIDEVGYDGVTTTLIAERAGVAVGSLYQFFPDKRAVVQALTTRNLDRFMESIGQRLASVTLEHWWDAVDLVFDAYVEMYRQVPGFTQIRFGDVVDLRL